MRSSPAASSVGVQAGLKGSLPQDHPEPLTQLGAAVLRSAALHLPCRTNPHLMWQWVWGTHKWNRGPQPEREKKEDRHELAGDASRA